MPKIKSVRQVRAEAAEAKAVQQFKSDTITVAFVLTNPKAVKYLRAACGWQQSSPGEHVKEILTDYLISLHGDVERAFDSRFTNGD
jgi:hypothetical protein